jgi:hypothetical protein
MRSLASLVLTGSLLMLVACNDGDTIESGKTQGTTVVGFSSFADAEAAREKLIAAGAEVSERLTFVDGQWTFESSEPYEPEPEVTGECRSTGTGRMGPGKTVCELRADAERERALLVVDGWECTEIVQTETGAAWEFEWTKVPGA